MVFNVNLSRPPQLLRRVFVNSPNDVHGGGPRGAVALHAVQYLALPRHPVLDVVLNLGNRVEYDGAVAGVDHAGLQLQYFVQ